MTTPAMSRYGQMRSRIFDFKRLERLKMETVRLEKKE